VKYAIASGYGEILFLTTNDTVTEQADDPAIQTFDRYDAALDWISRRSRSSRVLCALSPIVCPYPAIGDDHR
jgi:hypothetical protein